MRKQQFTRKDKTVKYGQTVCFVYGRRASGAFNIRLIDGMKVHACISYRKLKQLSHSDGTLTERRPPAGETVLLPRLKSRVSEPFNNYEKNI